MSVCPNINSPEWKTLESSVGRVEAMRDWLEYKYTIRDPELVKKKIQDRENEGTLKGLENTLMEGFLKDFNITINEYDSLLEDLGIDAFTATDLITKSIAIEKGQSILPEVAYIAYKLLGKENDKVRKELRALVYQWDKYEERFAFHRETTLSSPKEGWIEEDWFNHIRDKVIVDFLRETLEKYYKNPEEFWKVLDRKLTKEDFKVYKDRWEWFLDRVLDVIKEFAQLVSLGIYSAEKKEFRPSLNDLGLSIANDILTRNYTYYNYPMAKDQIIKRYNQTLDADPFAKTLIEKFQGLGLILTGSLALRKAGDVYRTAEESIHDIDWVVGYDTFASEDNQKILENIKKINSKIPKPIKSDIKTVQDAWKAKVRVKMNEIQAEIEKLDWIQKIKKMYPDMVLTNSFYGPEHVGNWGSITTQAAIGGSFYDEDGVHEEEISYYVKDPITKVPSKVKEMVKVEHKKGDYVKGTGYMLDFFIRLEPFQEEHQNYFLLWKQIMLAKLKMGRAKDFSDWVVFMPGLPSDGKFNFNYHGFRHFNYEDTSNWMYNDTTDPSQSKYITKEKVAYMKPGPFQQAAKNQARDLIIQNFGTIYLQEGDLSKNDLDYINSKLARLNTGDVPWKMRLSKDGNYYLAGYQNKAVLRDDYWSEPWRNSFYRPDPDNLTGNSISSMNKPQYLDNSLSDNERGIETIRKMAEMLRYQTGIQFEFITEEQARKLTEGSDNPWTNEPAMFVGNTVYFVGNKVRLDMAVHEFSHPIVRAISMSNPKLFNSLYEKLVATPEGQDILEQMRGLKYGEDLTEGSDMWKEEAIVRSLTNSAMLINNKKARTNPFIKFINDLLFAIKQFLRSVFGQKTSVSKLNENTTIQDLAKMLMDGGKIDIETDVVTEPLDAVAYLREQEEEIQSMMGMNEAELKGLIKKTYEIAINHIDMILKNKNYEAMVDVLSDEFGTGELQDIRQNLAKYRDEVTDKFGKVKDEVELNRERATAYVNTLFRLDSIVGKIVEHMELLQEKPDSIDNLHKGYYYQQMLNYWKGLITETKAALAAAKDIKVDSRLVSLVNRIGTRIDKSKDIATEIYSQGGRDILFKEMEGIAKDIDSRYQEIIADLLKRKASQKIIDVWFEEYNGMPQAEYQIFLALQKKHNEGKITASEEKEYQEYRRKSFEGTKITKDKIEAALKAEMEDANPFSSFLEGYLYNPDPVVGGLALYVKNNMTEVLATAQAKANDFMNEIAPDLEKAGYNPSNVSQLAGKIATVVTTGYNEKGNWTPRQRLRFLSPHAYYDAQGNKYGWEYPKDELQFQIDQAQQKWTETGAESDRDKLLELKGKLSKLEKDYFYDDFVPEFYTLRDRIFNRDNVGRKALAEVEYLMKQIRLTNEVLTSQMDELDEQVTAKLDSLWRQYRMLHSRYDANHQLKTGEDLEIANRLQEYRRESSKFYEWKPRKGNLFQKMLSKFEQELLDEWNSVPGRDEAMFDSWFDAKRNQWIEANTYVSVKESFYTQRAKLLNRLKEIQDALREEFKARKEAEGAEIPDVSELWSKILSVTSVFRDQDNEANAIDMGPKTIAMIKETQLEIIAAMEELGTASGLSKKESKELSQLMEKKKVDKILSTSEQARLQKLMDIKNANGLSEKLRKEMTGIYEDLNAMQSKEATSYYADAFNEMLRGIPDLSILEKKIGRRFIDGHTANLALENEIIDELRAQSRKGDGKFDKWFEDNHILKTRYDKELDDEISYWERVYPWNVIRPSDETYLESTKIVDRNGKEDTIYRVPKKNKYWLRRVKKQYHTGYNKATDKVEITVGVHKDNKGRWLPRLDVKDSPFIDKEYIALKNGDKANFKVLQTMTKYHLKNQEGLAYRSRLYMDVPRFRKSNLELAQTQQLKRNLKAAASGHFPFLHLMMERIRNFYRRRKDAYEAGLNMHEELKDDYKLVRADMFDNEVSSIPIAGLYDIDVEDVSTNLIESSMRYGLSADRQKKLTEITPVVRALQTVLGEHGPKNFDAINRYNFLHRNIVKFINKKGTYTRKKAVDNFIEREFEGTRNTGMLSDVPWLNNTADLIFKRAAVGFFALNIPSALKNQLSAKFQSLVHSAAGDNMNFQSWSKAEIWATNTMAHISFELYKRGPKSLNIQLVELFDAIQGKFEEKYGENLSRTLASDTANFSWLMNFRKWTEQQATIQVFGGMMYYKQVKRKMKDGSVKDIDYMDAWEVKNGKIQLKEGVDPEWGITYNEQGEIQIGSEFKRFKNKVQQTLNNLNGAYASFDQPEAGRYLAFRFISFLRRYFTTMAINRWGFRGSIGGAKPRLNLGLGELHEGYYITVMKTLSRMFTADPKYLAFMTKQEKIAWTKFLMELGLLIAITAVITPLLGWDPDDEDRYEKLRERSGAMPFFGLVPEDPDHPFDGFGFLENHLLNLALQVRAESESFVPWPNFGLDDYTSLLDFKSIATGPTLKAYKEIFTSSLDAAMGDPSGYYKRAVGPYWWQDEGAPKFLNQFFKAIGFTGGSIDPVMTIKNAQSIKVRGK